MTYQVHNKHWYKTKPEPPGAIYIGRPRRSDPPSPLANPFSTEQNCSGTVTVVADPMAAYKRWIWHQLHRDTAARREIARLAALPDGVLLCWCKPHPCHGDIVAAAIDWWRQQQALPVARCRICDAPIAWGLNRDGYPAVYSVTGGVVTTHLHNCTGKDFL
ncbi:MAG TPA: DUF4326 domain-containing protein [Herpetosiphonaceae bacterium]